LSYQQPSRPVFAQPFAFLQLSLYNTIVTIVAKKIEKRKLKSVEKAVLIKKGNSYKSVY
jgi:hypothetical protein